MTIIDARSLSDAEIESKKREIREELFNLRIQQRTGQLERPSRLRELKKDCAYLETVLSERRLGLKVVSKPKQAKQKKEATA